MRTHSLITMLLCLIGVLACSGGGATLPDLTPPTPGVVNDGLATDVDYLASNVAASANWTGFADTGTGIAYYEWAIGSTPGGTDLQGWANVGLNTSATAAGIVLQSDQTYYTSVRAIDGATNIGGPAHSNGFVVGSYSNSIAQHGITWAFDDYYQVGQFVNGDWWVVGPVIVVGITPVPTGTGADARHGSMVNPMPGDDQAYDGRADTYTASLFKVLPLTLSSGDSLVSSESILSYPITDLIGNIVTTGKTFLKNAAILTCLNSPPPLNAFRPPYVGSSKPYYLTTSLQLNLLPRLAVPASAPSLAAVERYVERPWIDHKGNWVTSHIHPVNNVPWYGRDLVSCLGDAALATCLDYTNLQKQKLLYGLVQIGIDFYHTALLANDLWSPDGGHMMGRKFPIVFAGRMLNDAGMLGLTGYLNHEDISTYFGADVSPNQTLWTGWQNSGHPYARNILYRLRGLNDMRGNPWSHEGYSATDWQSYPFPNNPNSPQYPFDKHEGYRRLVSYAWIGEAMAARILGMQTAWGHDAFFSYVDRWMNEDDSPNRTAIAAAAGPGNWAALVPGPNWASPATYYPFGRASLSAFAKDMYTAHRANY